MGRSVKKDKCRSCRELVDFPICVKIAEDLRKDITANSGTEEEQHLLKTFMTLETITVHSVKSIVNKLEFVCPSSRALLLRTFLRCFLIADANSSLRSIVASILDRVNGWDDATIQMPKMLSVIVGDFLQCIRSDLSTETGRHMKDVIGYCVSSNFNIGQRIVMSISQKILSFLCDYLNHLILSDTTSSKILQSDICSGFKCLATLLKRIMEHAEICNHVEDYVIENCLQVCRRLFLINDLEWDCYCAAGLAFISLLRATNDDGTLLSKLREAILHPADDGTRDYIFPTYHRQLSICNATLALLSHKTLFKTFKQQSTEQRIDNILTKVLLPSIKDVDQKCKLISDQLIVAKCYVQWSKQYAKACMDDGGLATILKIEEKSILNDLFDIAINKLSHPTDAIRHQANDILVNILKIGETIGCEFSYDLLDIVMYQSWKKRSTFTALNCILHHVSVEMVLEKWPNVAESLLTAIVQQSLAPYASETYRILAEKSLASFERSGCNIEDRYEKFFDPLLDFMCQSSISALQFLVNHCFVKLLKLYGESAVNHLLEKFKQKLFELDSQREANTQVLASFLNCLKLSITHGIVTDANDDVYDESVQILINSSLLHQNDQIRQLAFSLFCESSKPSSCLSTYTLDSIRYALPFNISCQDASFRQNLINSIKKMLLRMKSNLLQLKKGSDCDEKIKVYHDFLAWLINFMSTQLDATAPYMKRITSVNIFLHLVNIFIDYGTAEFHPCSNLYTIDSVQRLFALLSDPYPDVRESAYILLSQHQTVDLVKSKISQEWLNLIYTAALDRANQCSQPENCTDSSYHLKLYVVLTSEHEFDQDVTLLRVCSEILQLLHQNLTMARKNLYLAATTSPMYGLLFCLKCLLQDVQFRDMPENSCINWRNLVSDAISICFEISEAVLPVVGSVSPEGHLPEIEQPLEEEVNGGLDDAWNKLPEIVKSLIIGDSIDDQEECVTRAISQQILVCCWRSAKESSLLLQELSSNHYPLDSSADDHDGIVSWKQLLHIGEHLRTQLRTARHRGAFEIAYYVFKAYCPRLWSIKHSELNSVPEKWLQTTLFDLENPDRLQDLCATRRSAGLPFFMQALLSCNKSAKGRNMLQNVMSFLLKLSQTPDDKTLVSKVHSLNILRGLVKDSSLGEEVLPYLSQCIMIAITGFKSTMWAVRNSSTLLFSALFTRVFGVKRDKNDSTSSKNRMSGKEFFSRLPGLHSFICDCLETVADELKLGGQHALAPILHPVLLLLSRVYPSTMQSAANASLAAFIPLLIKCRATAVYKSRVAASVALASIVSWNECLDTLKICCDQLERDVLILCGVVKQEEKSSPHNQVHGGLLQVKELLLKFADEDAFLRCSNNGFREVVRPVRRALRNVFGILKSKGNHCVLTKSAAIELFLVIRSLIAAEDEEMKDREDVEGVLASSIEIFKSDEVNSYTPGQTFLLEVAATFLMTVLPRFSEIVDLLKFLISKEDSEKLRYLIKALLKNWDVTGLRLRQDLFSLENIVASALLHGMWNDEIVTLLYQILTKCVSDQCVKVLLVKSLDTASTCNASQSKLHVALIEFQAVSINLMMKQHVGIDTVVVNDWLNILSRSSRSFENTDDVRLAVAKSLSANFSVYILQDGRLSATVVTLWEVLINLLCDEESSIRMVASDVVYKINKTAFTKTGIPDDHPCIDSLSLHHAFRLMILTQGHCRTKECHTVLEGFMTTQSADVVPATLEEPDETKTPCLFERSQVNTYYDSRRIADAAQEALVFLNSLQDS